MIKELTRYSAEAVTVLNVKLISRLIEAILLAMELVYYCDTSAVLSLVYGICSEFSSI